MSILEIQIEDSGETNHVKRSYVVLDSEPPHWNLYLYHGVLWYKGSTTSEEKQELVTINEFLLRGCAVRNTSWPLGHWPCHLYGANAKIMVNGGDPPTKRSKTYKNRFCDFLSCSHESRSVDLLWIKRICAYLQTLLKKKSSKKKDTHLPWPACL